MPAPAHYASDGWRQWPEHPQASAVFTRVLGGASLGAGSVGECLRTASLIDPANEHSWREQWTTLAARVLAEARVAQRDGRLATARALLLRAAAYFRAAEFLLPPGSTERAEAAAQGVHCTREWLGLSAGGEVVTITLPDGGTLHAYFLAPAGGPRPWAAVICFGGLDAYKEEVLARSHGHLSERGLAMLVVDLPGQGQTRSDGGLALRPEVEVAVSACVDWLDRRSDIDASRLALWGASLGGVLAARAAARIARFRAVVSDSCIFDLEAHLSNHLAATGGKGWELLLWVFGCDTPGEVIAASAGLRMRDFVGAIGCPYLVVQGEHDFLGVPAARDAYEFAISQGVQAEFRLFTADETAAAHCQADNPVLGQELTCDWLSVRMGR